MVCDALSVVGGGGEEAWQQQESVWLRMMVF